MKGCSVSTAAEEQDCRDRQVYRRAALAHSQRLELYL
jgi:hypothetical protein